MTGGSRGIGLMIAKGFAEAGANVLLTSRDEKACAEAAKSLESENVCYVASNVSSREGCVALAKHTASVFDKKLDVLVNNAGEFSSLLFGAIQSFAFHFAYYLLTQRTNEPIV